MDDHYICQKCDLECESPFYTRLREENARLKAAVDEAWDVVESEFGYSVAATNLPKTAAIKQAAQSKKTS